MGTTIIWVSKNEKKSVSKFEFKNWTVTTLVKHEFSFYSGVDAYCGDFCNNMPINRGMILGESTGSSIGNNMTSSRESLGNISQQSTSRRKISITSHSKSGGKIPWCACWGNGCI